MPNKLGPCPKCACFDIESADDIGYDDHWYCVDCGYMEPKDTWNTRAYLAPVRELVETIDSVSEFLEDVLTPGVWMLIKNKTTAVREKVFGEDV